jgi:flagellar hook-associated protein 2
MGIVPGVGTISVDGVATGLSTSSLLDELVKVVSGPKIQIQKKITQYETLASLYTTLNSRLTAVDTALEAIEDTDDFRAFTTTTTDDSLTVTAEGDAIAGSYDVTVTQLAKAQIDTFQVGSTTEWETTTEAIFSGSGTITLSVSGTDTDITVDASTSLSDLASDINDIDGVSAYIVQTKDADSHSGGVDAFTLVIQADDAGEYSSGTAGARIEISDDLSDSLSLNNVQAASNAIVDISGVTVESESNTITAIDGLTIKATEEGVTSTVTVALDSSAMADKVQTFVTAYNSVVSFISTNSNFSSSGTNQESVTMGAFVGESAPRMILQRLSSLISKDYASDLSLSSATDRTTLAQMGISTQQSGLLSFSATEFKDSLADFQDDVELLFSDTTGSFSARMREQLDSFIDPLTGTLQDINEVLDNEVENLEDALEY